MQKINKNDISNMTVQSIGLLQTLKRKFHAQTESSNGELEVQYMYMHRLYTLIGGFQVFRSSACVIILARGLHNTKVQI